MTGGGTRIRVGTLYAALDRLAREGLVTVQSNELVAGRNRRIYRLTGDGRAVLDGELSRLEALMRQARTRLATPSPARLRPEGTA